MQLRFGRSRTGQDGTHTGKKERKRHQYQREYKRRIEEIRLNSLTQREGVEEKEKKKGQAPKSGGGYSIEKAMKSGGSRIRGNEFRAVVFFWSLSLFFSACAALRKDRRYVSSDQNGGERTRKQQILNADSRYNEVGCRRFSRLQAHSSRPLAVSLSRPSPKLTQETGSPRAGMRSLATLSERRN